jgi:hypothetical protein
MRVGEIRYHERPDTRTQIQGVRSVGHTSRRDGMPQAPERGARYTEVRTSVRIAAWLDGEDDGEVEDGNASN